MSSLEFAQEPSLRQPLAIVGIGCRLPGGVRDADSYWEFLAQGRSGVVPVPPDRWNRERFYHPDRAIPGRMITQWGGFVEGIDQFDPQFWGIAPREAMRMDPQQRWLLETSWEAIEDAGIAPSSLRSRKVGVFVGVAGNDYAGLQMPNYAGHDVHTNSGCTLSIASNRISYLLDLRGPSASVDTACSSALVAVSQACQSIWSGDCEAVLAGGVNAIITPHATLGFSKASMLSPSGQCFAFDRRANGYVRGEGAAMILIKPLANAIQDHDRIYSVIRAAVVNSDGHTSSMTVPGVDGQSTMLRQAYREAGIPPHRVQYMEAHGTGTPVGDPIEATALGNVLSEGRSDDRPCIMGSVKTNIGHLESGSGIAGLVKAALVLHHDTIPPNRNFEHPNPNIPFAKLRLRIADRLQPLPRPAEGLPVVGVNSFGFGGTNAHIVLEAAPESTEEAPTPTSVRSASNGNGKVSVKSQTTDDAKQLAKRPCLLPVSARDDDALQSFGRAYRDFLQNNERLNLQQVAYSAGARREHHPHRMVVMADTVANARTGIADWLGGEPAAAPVIEGRASEHAGDIVFVFTGQGAQWWRMGRELYERESVFRSTLDRVDRLLKPLAGWSLVEELVGPSDESESKIHRTTIAQPAIFAVQIGLVELWKSWGVQPSKVVGHSVGELAAAYAAGIYSLEDAVKIIFHRSRLQDSCPGDGRMLAVGISAAEARQLIGERSDEIQVAVINSPSLVTLAGDREPLETLAATLESEGKFVRWLRINYAFHSHHMEPIREELLESLADIQPRSARIPFISTVSGGSLPGESLDAMYWWRNVRQPVLFSSTLDNLVVAGERLFLEIGPHPALESAINEILTANGKQGEVYHSLRRKTDETENLLRNLSQLYVNGTEIDWAAVNQYHGPFVRLPGYPWQHDSYWLEAKESAHDRLDPIPHPLLGQRLIEEKPVWRFRLDPRLFDYMTDHRIWDSIICPGAAYGEVGLAVARELFPEDPCVVEDLEIKKALFVSEDNVPIVRVTFEPEDRSYSIHSTTDEENWELNARGRIVEMPPQTPSVLDIASKRDELPEHFSHAAYYNDFTEAGYEFGPNFQQVENVYRVHGEVLAEICVPEFVEATVDQYRFHPAVLDACFHVFRGMNVTENPADNFFLPAFVRRIRLYRETPPSHLWAHAKLCFDDGDTLICDIWVYDESGERVADILGFRVERMEQKSADTDLDSCYFQYRWTTKPLAGSRIEGSCFLKSPREVASAVASEQSAIHDRFSLHQYYHRFVPQLETVIHHSIQNACIQLGWTPNAGDEFSLEDFISNAGIVTRHHRLARAEMQALEQAGVLASAGEDRWRVRQPFQEADIDELLSDLVAEFPAQATEIALHQAAAPQLAKVLTGHVDPMNLLFPDGSSEMLSEFYNHGFDFPAYAELIPNAVAKTIESLPPRRVLRVLEVGAGTGSLTHGILPKLPVDRCRYVYTDIGPAFLTTAKQRFEAYDFIDYRTFDVEQDPSGQGLESHSFDLILATNVLHATADLTNTIGNLKSLLAPAGTLMFQEVVRRRAAWDNAFGLLKGWWCFTDTDLRSDSALLSEDQWQQLLQEQGFAEVASFSTSQDPAEMEQAVLIASVAEAVDDAEIPDTEAESTSRSVYAILADRGGVAEQLATQLRAHGHRAITLALGDTCELLDEDMWSTTTDLESDLKAALEGLDRSKETLQGIVHCWSLDAPLADGMTTESLDTAQEAGVLSALKLSKYLADQGLDPAPRVHFVTRDAIRVVDSDRGDHLSSAPLVGFSRVANNEHFPHRWTVIDLSVEPHPHDVDNLADEVLLGDSELEVAYRNDQRHVVRLHAVTTDDLTSRTRNAVRDGRDVVPYRLETGKPGVLTRLSLHETRRRDPGDGEIEVRVQAGGINFRDVMKALGMYPGNPIDLLWFGDDFSGVIERVGPGVSDLKPGDTVAGMAPYSFRAFHTVDRRMVFPKPDAISFADAATLPTVFLTAHYALRHLARLEPKERVLIHAGTGGVGQAAIQIAKHLGLEIFATAGTDEKRDLLREMRVHHVMNSRTLDFADEIMDITEGEGVDAVLNSLAGEFIPKSFSVLAPFGRFLEIGKIDVYNNTRFGMETLKDNISYFVIDLAQHLEHKPDFIAKMFSDLSERFHAGDYLPLPHKTFPINEVVEAFRFMAQGKHIGKNVLEFDVDSIPIGPTTEEEHLLRSDASYLIVGGAGGFGLELAKWMSQHGAQHLVLLSRSGPRDEQAAADIQQLRNSGMDVVDARGDVTQLADVERVIQEIEASGHPLRGVIHGAMVLDDEFLINLDDSRFNKVLRPKILGAWNLHLATHDLELEHFVCFSSFSSIVGGAKQSNYNAGNYFLDALAHHRQAHGLPALTINWSALSGAGFVARNQKTADYLDKLGMKPLAMEEAFSIFGRMLVRNPVQIAACRADWQSFARLSPLVANSNAFSNVVGSQSGGAGGSIKRQILATAPAERLVLIENFLTDQVAGVFGVDASKVDRSESLTKLGLDSLMAVDLINRIEGELSMSLPMGSVLRGPNITELAAVVGGLVSGSSDDQAGSGESSESSNTSLVPLEHSKFADQAFPLSEGQQALWFLYRLAPDSSAYNLTFSAKFTPHVDLDAMQRAFESLFERHPMLDVTFSDEGGVLRQRPRRGSTLDFREHDVTELSQAELSDRLVELANRPFDLENGPVIRLDLLRTEDGHIGLMCMHHIISDAWSVTLLVRDLTESYFTIKAGRRPQFDEQRYGFEDFVGWEQSHLSSDAGRRMGQYWQQLIADAPLLLDLPTDHPRPTVQSFRGATLGFKLEGDLTLSLLQIAAEQNVTLFTLLLSAYEVLLHRYTGQPDFLVGCPMAGRQHNELHNTVGYFVNPVPLRSRVDDDPSFLDYVSHNHGQVADALRNQQYPLKRLVNDLGVPRDTCRSPLFQVAFSMERIPGFDQQGIAVFLVGEGGHKFQLGELQMETVDLILRQAQFEILLVVEESGGNVYGCWQYNRDLFEPETIDRLNGMFEDLLQQIIHKPDQRISEFALSSAHEFDTTAEVRERQLAWNQTDRARDESTLVHQRIEAQAAATPDAVALVHGGTQLTYAELNARANQLAAYLRDLGVGPNTKVGLCLERGVEVVIAMQAILKAGGAYVPLDPNYPQARLQRIAESASLFAVITQSVYQEQLGDECGQVICIDTDSDAIKSQPTTNFPCPASGDDLIYVIYTSGSTGVPKGAGVYHRGFANLVDWFLAEFEIGSRDRTLVFSSHGFDLTQKNLYASLMVGGQLHLSATRQFAPDPIAREIKQHNVTLVNCTPSTFYPLVDADEPSRIADLNSVRCAFLGGEPIDMERLAAWRNRPGFQAEVVNTYGPTECTDICSFYRVAADSEETSIPIGFPIHNVQTFVMDEYRRPVAVGVTGELCIAGISVGAGYIDDPELTRRKFVPHPFGDKPDARLYRTGDLCRYRADGAIEFVGRVDDQIKLRGFRIELGEIEQHLKQHDSVSDAVVVARQDAKDVKRLAAFVVLEDGAELDAGALRDFVAERLPDYMVPSYFVARAKLPLTPHGKIDRLRLASADIGEHALAAGPEYVAPSDVIEQKLVAIWQETLGLDSIGIRHRFFEYGGDSLLSVVVISKIRQEFGVEIPLAMLIQEDTIAQLAAYLRGKSSESWSPLVVARPYGDRPALFLIHPVGGNVACYSELIDRLGDDQPVYAIQARGVDGQLQPFTSLDDMVEEYLEAIRSVQPSGPYHFAAWSSGGVIAYELARRLDVQGQSVGSVTLIDSLAASELDIDVEDDVTIMMELIQFLNRFYQLGVRVNREELAPLSNDERRTMLMERLQAVAFLPIGFDDDFAQRFIDLCQANLKAIRDHQQVPHPLPVTLLRAEDSDRNGDADPTLGWAALLDQQLNVETSPGDHVSMLRGDGATRLARRIRSIIAARQTSEAAE